MKSTSQFPAWQPIESAPKDGTVIDLWFNTGSRIPDCYWSKDIVPRSTYGGCPKEGWGFEGRDPTDSWDTVLLWAEDFEMTATHWMPRPEPPDITENDEGRLLPHHGSGP